jgi:glutaredoxin-related protein
MKLTLDEIKQLVNIVRLDRKKENGYGICLECGQDEFGISLKDNHRFGCFRKKACGFSGNIFTLLRYLGKSIAEVKPGFEPRAKLGGKLMIDEEKEKLNVELEDCSMPTGWKRVMDHWYLEQRGFTKEDYERFEVGVTTIDPRFREMVIFKVSQNGTNKAYIARSTKAKKEIERLNKSFKAQGSTVKVLRYKNSESEYGKILLGIEECTENTTTVIVVEGLFDKINTDRQLRLLDQEEIKCVCSFKCGCSDEQVMLLQQTGIDTIVLLYDPDVINEIKKAAWDLENYFNVHVGFDEMGRDPGDMLEEDFDEVFKNLRTPSQFSTEKMNVLELRKK